MGAGFTVWHIIGSMRAVDKWSQAAQSNISNSTRVGYKEYDVKFGGGGGVSLMRNPTMAALGNQVAEQVITAFGTSINWNQGELIQTNSDKDFAINGDGFFMLTEGIPSAANTKTYYSRNGQFHFDGATGRLVNEQGLFFVTRQDSQTMGLLPAGASTTLTIAALAGDTSITVASAAAANIRLNSFIQIGNDIVKVQSVNGNVVTFTPALSAPAAIGDSVGDPYVLALPSNIDDLMYSRFGSTVFEDGVGNTNKTVDVPESSGLGQIKRRTLETSNVKIANQITSLNDSKNMYAGLSKTLIVFFQNFEIGLNLLK